MGNRASYMAAPASCASKLGTTARPKVTTHFIQIPWGQVIPATTSNQESQPPSTNLTTFNADRRSGINSRYNSITADTSVQPYPVNYSETGVPLGNVCYAPYAACP